MARDTGRETRPVPGKFAEAVVLDIADGPSVEIGRNGPRAVRVARVFGAKGTPAARIWLALRAQGVPKYGDLHPAIEGLPVGRVSAAFEEGSTDIVTVTCEYFYFTGGPAYFTNDPGDTVETLPQLEVLSTVHPVTTQFDINGDQILVAYLDTLPEGVEGPPAKIVQAGSVEYMLPMETVRYMRREAYNPQGKAKLYVGTINSLPVLGDTFKHMWMCTRLDGVSDDGGATFNVTYEFQRNPDTWEPFVAPIDPATGQFRILTPADLALVDGARHVLVFRETDFWELGLTVREDE